MRRGPAPRETCSICGRITSVRDDGTIRRHGRHTPSTWWCPGSLMPPKRAASREQEDVER